MAKHNEIGVIGEDIAVDFLRQKGYRVVSRNFRKPYGEIDIIAFGSDGVLRFIEVKSVSWETRRTPSGTVPHETPRPEENVHPNKIKRLIRVIESYLISRETDSEWEFDVIAVFVNRETKEAKVRHMKNVILGA